MKSNTQNHSKIQTNITKDSLHPDPIEQTKQWLNDSINANIHNPNAATLATVDIEGQPSSRIILIKEITSNGLTFFTNYNSQKAEDLSDNNRVSLLFYWRDLNRQIRIKGTVTKTSKEENNTYFKLRPRGSQIMAHISNQSTELTNREMLDSLYKEFETKNEDNDLTCPPFWGGYLIMPTYFEFWQEQAYRMHDRICYTPLSESKWDKKRLAP